VVVIHKKKKNGQQNYRPDSLLSVVAKVLEKIIVNAMISFFEHHNLLSIRQFGFSSNRSASDLLLTMTTEWDKALDRGTDTYVIALDIAGAFDRVWHRGLTAKLRSYGISGPLLTLLTDYLEGRSLHAVLNGHSSSVHPTKASVPQGSVLGPLLWNIYFNDILPQARAYVDDCILTFTCKKKQQAETIDHI